MIYENICWHVEHLQYYELSGSLSGDVA